MKRVFFIIPLAARRSDEHWSVVTRMLGRTLRSVLNQTDPDFQVIIAGHDRPEIKEMADSRITFLTATSSRPQDPKRYMGDKSRKKRMLAREVADRGGGYMTFLDADDLVSARLVEHIRTVDDPHGYIFTFGYMLDEKTGSVAPCPGATKNAFDQVCGSCASIYFAEDELRGRDSLFAQFESHRLFASTAERLGRPLHRTAFPAAIYVINHSQNDTYLKSEAKGERRDVHDRVAEWGLSRSAAFDREFALDLG